VGVGGDKVKEAALEGGLALDIALLALGKGLVALDIACAQKGAACDCSRGCRALALAAGSGCWCVLGDIVGVDRALGVGGAACDDLHDVAHLTPNQVLIKLVNVRDIVAKVELGGLRGEELG